MHASLYVLPASHKGPCWGSTQYILMPCAVVAADDRLKSRQRQTAALVMGLGHVFKCAQPAVPINR